MERTNYKRFQSSVHPSELAPIGIDTHAHLSTHYFNNDIDSILIRAKQASLASVLSVCLNEQAYEDACRLYTSLSLDVYSAIAIHPCDVLKDTTSYKARFRTLLKEDNRIKAVGETGLDYHWKDIPYDIQKDSFLEHIALAKEYAKPLVLHTRDAEYDVYDILCKEAMAGQPVIWHCYSGDAELACRIVDKGWYISFAGNITYPNAQNIREAFRCVPSTHILIETDCPYLAPQAVRGSRNEPAYLMYIAEVLAHECDVDVNTVWTWTSNNARAVLSL